MNFFQGDIVTEYNGELYLVNDDDIWKSTDNASTFESIHTEDGGYMNNIEIVDNKLYYAKDVTMEMDLENLSSNVEVGPNGFVYEGKLYYSESSYENETDESYIGIMDLATGETTQLTEVYRETRILGFSGDYLYWEGCVAEKTSDTGLYNGDDYRNFRTNIKDGSFEELSIRNTFAGVSKDYILYWDEEDLWRANLDGENATLVFDVSVERFHNNMIHPDDINNTDDYIALSYPDIENDSTYFYVMDFDGNIINEIENHHGDDICILNDYIYFVERVGPSAENVYRFYYDSPELELLIENTDI